MVLCIDMLKNMRDFAGLGSFVLCMLTRSMLEIQMELSRGQLDLKVRYR